MVTPDKTTADAERNRLCAAAATSADRGESVDVCIRCSRLAAITPGDPIEPIYVVYRSGGTPDVAGKGGCHPRTGDLL